MILTCSACTTRFLVDPAAVGRKGRHVRCAKCLHVWFQEPPLDLPKSLALDDAKGEAAPRRPQPLRAGANLPAIPKKRGRLRTALPWFGLIGFVAAIIIGGYLFRAAIVASWPPAAKLYDTLGIAPDETMLQLVGVSFAQKNRDGISFLEVSGKVVNESANPVQLPEILIILRDAQDNIVYQWRHRAEAGSVPAQGEIAFTTARSQLPESAQNLEVTLDGKP